MTAADRPSVTDNARAEQSAMLADADTILTAALSLDPTGYRIEGANSAARLATALRAAGRAETTTDNLGDAYMLGYTAAKNAETTNLATPLATARTRPTREQVIDVLREKDPDNHNGWHSPADHYYEAQADAVLALLNEEAGR